MDVGDEVVVYKTGTVTMVRNNLAKGCKECEVTYYADDGRVLGVALVKEEAIEMNDLNKVIGG